MRCEGHCIFAVDPVLVEARACYRVPIGAARASYGVTWMFKPTMFIPCLNGADVSLRIRFIRFWSPLVN